MQFSCDEVTPDMENEVLTAGLLPQGEHLFCIESTEHKPNRAGNGEILKITLIPVAHPTRKLWHYINVKHENPQAEKFGKVELKKILMALEMPGFNDHEELRGRTLLGTVKHVKEQDSSRLREQIVLWAIDKSPI